MARGFTRDTKGRFRDGFNGLKPVAKTKLKAKKLSATKARRDKQNLVTRGGANDSERFPVKTNVKQIRTKTGPGGSTRHFAKEARATSARETEAFGSVKKGSRFVDLNVDLSKNQQARVDDFNVARPKRIAANAAKKKAAFSKQGTVDKAPGLAPQRGKYEGRDPRTMSPNEQIDAYQIMHGKPPTEPQRRKLAASRPATHNEATAAHMGREKTNTTPSVTPTRPETNATPSVSPSRDNSTPLTPPVNKKLDTLNARIEKKEAEYAEATRRRMASGNLKARRASDPELKRLGELTKLKNERAAITGETKISPFGKEVPTAAPSTPLPASKPRISTTDNAAPLDAAQASQYGRKTVMDYNAMTSKERNELEARAQARLNKNRKQFENHPDDKPYSKAQSDLIKMDNALEDILRKVRVSRRTMGG